MPHPQYNEWLDKAGTGTCSLKQQSPQPIFESWVGTKLAQPVSLFSQ